MVTNSFRHLGLDNSGQSSGTITLDEQGSMVMLDYLLTTAEMLCIVCRQYMYLIKRKSLTGAALSRSSYIELKRMQMNEAFEVYAWVGEIKMARLRGRR